MTYSAPHSGGFVNTEMKKHRFWSRICVPIPSLPLAGYLALGELVTASVCGLHVLLFTVALGDETQTTKLNKTRWSFLGKGAKGGVDISPPEGKRKERTGGRHLLKRESLHMRSESLHSQ